MSNIATVKINYSEEYQNLADILGVSFVEGNVYTCQVLGSYGINILEASEKPTSGGFLVNAGEKFQFTAGTDSFWVRPISEKTDTYINVAGVVAQAEEKGSFDGTTQTLTFNNAYIVGLINELSGESAAGKETLLGYIGDLDLTFDLSNATESDEIITCDSENTVTVEEETLPLATLSWKAVDGVVSIVIADWISIADATVFAIEGIENLDDLIPFGVAMDKNIITITGTQGDYDVTFN